MRAMIGVCVLLTCAAGTFAVAGPATRPADVLVLAFDPIPSDSSNNTIGQGIQQTLLAELGRMKHLRGTLPTSQPAAEGSAVTPESALVSGRMAGARYVVFGAYQISGPLMRLTGQVLDVEHGGEAAGSMKVTVAAGDVFEAQDALCLQLRRILPAPMTEAAIVQPATRPMTAEERWPWRHSSSSGWSAAGAAGDGNGSQFDAAVDATMRRLAVRCGWPGGRYGFWGTNLYWGMW